LKNSEWRKSREYSTSKILIFHKKAPGLSWGAGDFNDAVFIEKTKKNLSFTSLLSL
jgi:hypothetical protein